MERGDTDRALEVRWAADLIGLSVVWFLLAPATAGTIGFGWGSFELGVLAVRLSVAVGFAFLASAGGLLARAAGPGPVRPWLVAATAVAAIGAAFALVTPFIAAAMYAGPPVAVVLLSAGLATLPVDVGGDTPRLWWRLASGVQAAAIAVALGVVVVGPSRLGFYQAPPWSTGLALRLRGQVWTTDSVRGHVVLAAVVWLWVAVLVLVLVAVTLTRRWAQRQIDAVGRPHPDSPRPGGWALPIGPLPPPPRTAEPAPLVSVEEPPWDPTVTDGAWSQVGPRPDEDPLRALTVGRRRVRCLAGVVMVVALGACSSATGHPGASPTTTIGVPVLRRVGFTYQVPHPLARAAPGQLIAASTTGPDRSVDAAQRWVFLYHSTDLAGHDQAVSGQLVVPAGRPPAGGWPVVSWAHGTSGIADRCTPSQHDLWDVENAQEVRTFVDAGYTVAATDYPGLGTPGIHPYLVGVDEGNAVVDVVSAARHLDPAVSADWFAVGHSQGGQAVLFATRSAARAPDLHLRATVSLAPASALNAILPAVISLGDLSDQAYAVFALIGLSVADPSVSLAQVLGPGARARLPIALDTGCIDQADAAFRQVATADLFALSPARIDQLDDELARTGNPDVSATVGPVLVLQGLTDGDVPAGATAALVAHLTQLGSTVTEKTYPGLDHDGVVGPSECDQLAWLASHGGRAVTRCTPHRTAGT